MSISFIQDNRTQNRNFLEKELVHGRPLFEGDAEQGEIKFHLMQVNICINRLNALQTKLENTGEKMSIVVDWQKEEEVLDLIKNRQ